jgi:tripartite-type tricarboxylate transporter receptor subunit TctC
MTLPLSITRRGALAGLFGTALSAGNAWAQSDRPLRLIVHTSAGGGTDAIFRTLQPALAKALGHPVVVENMPGAGGMISWQAVARAQPDGFTLAATSNNLVIQPHLMKSPPLDVTTLKPISIIGETPVVIVANPTKIQARNAPEFIGELKARSSSLNYGSAGAGSTLQLAVEMLLSQVGVKVRHIPYKGVAPFLTDLVGGQVDFGCHSVSVALPYIRSGALRAIGVCSPQRAPIANDLPTFMEQGMDYAMKVWFGVFGPKGMPPELVRKLNTALTAALADPSVHDAMVKQGNLVQASSAEEAQKTTLQDFDAYRTIVGKLDLSV